jgi:hypothetical protein
MFDDLDDVRAIWEAVQDARKYLTGRRYYGMLAHVGENKNMRDRKIDEVVSKHVQPSGRG